MDHTQRKRTMGALISVIRRIGRRSVLVTGLIGALVVPPIVVLAATSGEDGLHQIATLAPGTSSPHPRMLVDTELNRGFVLGGAVDDQSNFIGTRMFTFDLERLRVTGVVKVPVGGLDSSLASVDEVHHRVLFPPGDQDITTGGCVAGLAGPRDEMAIQSFDIASSSWSQLPLPCSTSGDQFKVEGLSYNGSSDRLYAVGTNQSEYGSRALAPGLSNQYSQAILMRQMSFQGGQLMLDWEVDLRTIGCDSIVPQSLAGGYSFVQRSGDTAIAYCYGPRNSSSGSQGFAVAVPLDHDGLIGGSANPNMYATPTLPNDLYPLMDPVSGKLLLLTLGAANGTAVWVYEPRFERFAGVIASGVSSDSNGSTYFGLNKQTGRTYFMNSAGILVADVRHNPLPSGLNFPLFKGMSNQGAGTFIAVAPKLHRLFIPIEGQGFAVIQDDIPEPIDPPAADPDRGTADVAEQQGKTGSVFAGAAAGFGAHLLNTGGIPRAAENADPACYSFLSGKFKDAQGRCLEEQLFTSGNRELFLGATQAELGSESGASAQATGGAYANNDTASDADMKRLGNCEADLIANHAGSVPDRYSSFCESTPLSVFASGTKGKDGSGFPIPGSACADFGNAAADQVQRPSSTGLPLGMNSSSSVKCDFAKLSTKASAAAAGLAIPNSADPILSIARSSSETTSKMTADGIETEVSAVASGVQVGAMSINHITTNVKTRAHGRTGTTRATFTRTIEGVKSDTIDCSKVVADRPGVASPCDYSHFKQAFNQALGQRVRMNLPAAERIESPHGYEGVVIKDAATRDSDRAVNDDDTFTVSGLEVVFYNDGTQGRNRVVVQLAGVQSEARYGIFLLPDEAAGSDARTDLGAINAGDFGVGSDPSSIGQDVPSLGHKIKHLIGSVLKYPAVALHEAWRLIVTNPREFAVLFVMWALLASPLYLGLRRAAFSRVVAR